MEQVINVQPRDVGGKGAARKLRTRGHVPGVLYGKQKPVSIALDPHELHQTVAHSGLGRNTVLHIRGLDRDILALLKDTQFDPVRRRLMHVDLIEINENQEVVVEVPVELTGKAKGIVDGGIIQMVRRTLRLACMPLSIPKSLSVDVTPLGIGQSLHVRDVVFPAGTRGIDPPITTVVSVHAPAAEEKPTEAEAAAAAGAAAAPGTAAAAPAAGGTAAAAPATEKKADEKETKSKK
jgi:large subunit ribosomal protein L25